MIDLRQAQVDLETLAAATARTKALEHLQASVEAGEAAAAAPVGALVREALPKAAERLQELLQEPSQQGTRVDAHEVLRDMDPDQLAYVGLNAMFTAALSQHSLVKTCQSAGTAAAVERWAQLTTKADPKKVQAMLKAGKQPGRLPKDAVSLGRLLAKHGGAPLDWDREFLVVIGGELLSACMVTGLFRFDEDDAGSNTVVLTEEAETALGEMTDTLPWQRPRLLPMLVEPEGWADVDTAPYLTEANRRYMGVLGKVRGRQLSQLRYRWEHESTKPFRRALDTLSRVPFQIDAQTVSAARWAWSNGLEVENIPQTTQLVYAAPEGLSDDFPDELKRLEWTKQREIRETNLLNRVLGHELEKDLGLAEMLQSYPAVWQPHFADYRGRLYTASSFSHHRSDHVRAMFRFQRGAPLGDKGLGWLKVHVANCAAGDRYGKLDKAPYQERKDWADQNRELFGEIDRNWDTKPELWTSAGSPFGFLQAAKELNAAYRWADYHGTAKGFQSSIIVGVDGTNSGLQHFAAALRCEDEGRLVNLVPGDRPSDVYAAVARRVVSVLQELSSGDAAEADAARQWLDYGVTRGTVKRQVMTFAYSSELFGFRDQIADDIMRPLKRAVLEGRLKEHPFGDDAAAFRASLVLARAIWEALQSVVVKAAEGMKWLKDVAGVLAKHKLGVEWTSPSGFPVVHRYMQGTEKRVGLTFGKAKVRVLTATNHQKKLVPHKQRSAMAPNFIHSQDAAHLHLTTCAMLDHGVEDLAMIHDSFGTQAGNVELLQKVLRHEFVGMYREHDPFQAVHRFALEALPAEKHKLVCPPPQRGALDIEAVNQSPYVFC